MLSEIPDWIILNIFGFLTGVDNFKGTCQKYKKIYNIYLDTVIDPIAEELCQPYKPDSIMLSAMMYNTLQPAIQKLWSYSKHHKLFTITGLMTECLKHDTFPFNLLVDSFRRSMFITEELLHLLSECKYVKSRVHIPEYDAILIENGYLILTNGRQFILACMNTVKIAAWKPTVYGCGLKYVNTDNKEVLVGYNGYMFSFGFHEKPGFVKNVDIWPEESACTILYQSRVTSRWLN
jgi:hypothetical protein